VGIAFRSDSDMSCPLQASQYGSYGSTSGSFDVPPQQTQYSFPGHQPQPSSQQVCSTSKHDCACVVTGWQTLANSQVSNRFMMQQAGAEFQTLHVGIGRPSVQKCAGITLSLHCCRRRQGTATVWAPQAALPRSRLLLDLSTASLVGPARRPSSAPLRPVVPAPTKATPSQRRYRRCMRYPEADHADVYDASAVSIEAQQLNGIGKQGKLVALCTACRV